MEDENDDELVIKLSVWKKEIEIGDEPWENYPALNTR